MKLIFTFFILFFNQLVLSQESIPYENLLKNKLNIFETEFNKKNSNKLFLEIFSLNNPILKSFTQTLISLPKDDHLGASYNEVTIINNEPSKLCIIYYNPDKNIFNNYISNKFSEEESINYLLNHEIGHCLAFYFKFKLNTKEHEIFADLFAITKAIENNNTLLVAKIINNNNKLKNDEIHYHPLILKNFYTFYISNSLISSSTTDSLNIIFNYIKTTN